MSGAFDFQPVTEDQFIYMEIVNDGFFQKIDPKKKRIEFWDGILTTMEPANTQNGSHLIWKRLNYFYILDVLVVVLNNFLLNKNKKISWWC